jgi:hypothetical protein
MLDRLLRRYSYGMFAGPATRVISAGISSQPLALAGFAADFAAVAFIAHAAYFLGLALIAAGWLLRLLSIAVARLAPRSGKEDFLDRLLELIWSASLPFGFALAQPARALAAMFLMLGLVARAAAVTVENRAAPGSPGATTEFGGELVGIAELSIVYMLLCLFPTWFSIAAYALGIACFVTTGIRVARYEPQPP